MRVARLVRHGKRPFGFGCGLWAKVAATATLALCFILLSSTFSSPPSSISSQRGSFSDIPRLPAHHHHPGTHPFAPVAANKDKVDNATAGPKHAADVEPDSDADKNGGDGAEEKKLNDGGDEEEDVVAAREDEASDQPAGDGDPDLGKEASAAGEQGADSLESDTGSSKPGTVKGGGPLFDLGAHYSWKLCNVRTGHNYIPCLDIENPPGKKLQRVRHHERSCPRTPMCLVPLPDGYASPIRWSDSKSRILYKNVAHPKLSVFIKSRTWLNKSEEFLVFPHSQSEFQGGASHYVDSIEEMVPDIEWGKNIRLVLDIGSADSSFNAALLDKGVLSLSLGLKDDEADLAQVALERGFPAMIGILGTRRLPFPGGVFDAIHCGECRIPWHLSGGKLLLEMNRILRPGGYFILSTERDNIEVEEDMSKLTASICWNILAHRTDEVSEIGVKIYQRPSSNEIYQLRRKKVPHLCKEDENPDAAWHSPILMCLHTVPAAIEERGPEWPEDWPQRLDNFPEWLSNREGLVQDTEHWRAIVNSSYLNGLGIDWSNVRNVMDMKAIYGGFAAALEGHKVWVMNVVPVNAPNTLPVIYERGLLGTYHDWCESFSTYPRTYDLLHADHLFSRLKNRCKRPVGIVVEMDRIVRPGGWVIIRDKVVILNPLREILKSLHWEIRMTYAKEKEGIICAQKTAWRP